MNDVPEENVKPDPAAYLEIVNLIKQTESLRSFFAKIMSEKLGPLNVMTEKDTIEDLTEGFINRGDYYSSRSNYEDEAILYYKKALLLDPSNIKIYLSLADLFRKGGDLDTAIEYCHNGLHINENSSDLRMLYADLLADIGRTEAAMYLYENVAFFKHASEPHRIKASRILGLYYSQQGIYSKCVYYLEHYFNLEGKVDYDVFLVLGNAYIHLNKLKDARYYLDECYNSGVRTNKVYMAMAEISRKSGNYAEASKYYIEMYEDSLALNDGDLAKTDFQPFDEIINMYSDIENSDEQVEFYENTKNALMYGKKVIYNFEENERANSLDENILGYQNREDRALGYMQLGDIYMKFGVLEEAKKYYAESLMEMPNQPELEKKLKELDSLG